MAATKPVNGSLGALRPSKDLLAVGVPTAATENAPGNPENAVHAAKKARKSSYRKRNIGRN
jgi:hypothetical protein